MVLRELFCKRKTNNNFETSIKVWLKHFSYSIHGYMINKQSHTFFCNFGYKFHYKVSDYLYN